MNQNETLKRPFFAQFLESQRVAKSQPNQQAIWPPLTLKIFDDLEHTLRYPSDNDDNPSVWVKQFHL